MQKQLNSFGVSSQKKKKNSAVFTYIQSLGRSLLYPISILPLAAIFMRVSAIIPNDTEFSKYVGLVLSAVGNSIFGPLLAIIFCVGLSFGLTKDGRGEAALVGLVTMTLFQIMLGSNSGSAGAAGLSGIGLIDAFYGHIPFHGFDKDGKPAIVHGFKKLFGGSMYTKVMVDNVLTGILVAIFVSTLYNKFHGIELPSILGFFSGRRLIPVLALTSGLVFSILWALIFPWIGFAIYEFSIQLQKATGNRYGNAAMMFVYGFINRLLIPFGLHHIPNTLLWFTFGSFDTYDPNKFANGDINIFLNGNVVDRHGNFNNSGTFQTGLFPIMLFGLPAISYAFYKNAQDDKQSKNIASVLLGASLVSFFTGITEPIEFTFLFVSPVLFGMHALLTGFWGFICGLFGIQLGFGFSAGFIDYALSLPKSLDIINAKLHGAVDVLGTFHKGIYNSTQAAFANPLMLILIGPMTALSYYFGASTLIKKFNQPAPGIAPNLIIFEKESEEESLQNIPSEFNKFTRDSTFIIKAVGKENIEDVNWCATRLRLTLKDNSKIDENLIKRTTSKGEIKIGNKGYQIIIGINVEMYGNEVKRLLDNNNDYEESIKTFLNKKKEANKSISTNNSLKNKKIISTKEIFSIGNGTVSDLSTLKDDAFKNKLLGDGVVIDCKDGKIYAPVDGKISSIFHTKHAFTISTVDNINILIHIGIDTNKLPKKTFNQKIELNDEIKKGQLIYEFDRNKIIDEKLDHRVILIITTDSERKIKKTCNFGKIKIESPIIELNN
ncbi:MAG: glucose PTS transporter subunit IIA [Mycoplasmoidaceae bacterium]